MSRKTADLIVYFISIAYVLASFYLYNYMDIKGMWIYYLVGGSLVVLALRSDGQAFDLIIALVIPLFFKHSVSTYKFFYLPLMVGVLVSTGYRLKPKILALVTFGALAPWWIEIIRANGTVYNFIEIVILLFCCFTMLKYAADIFRKPVSPPEKIDVMLCSYSSNTAHYTYQFIEGLKEEGKQVTVHRQHYYRDFNPEFKGDTFVLAFPIYGWKPPWTTVTHILKRLPRGKGKPAFILYSSAGGPENAGVVAWFLLKLKGYRVLGRSWAAYPVNVVTFRIGPRKMWDFLDKQLPSNRDVKAVKEYGREFARGERTGMPLQFWPFPLAVFGFLLENKFVNRFLYKTYTWKWRCSKCQICVNYCPAERFSLKDGFPKSKGDCTLCLSCINLCPERAMQMVALSEYGNPYRPRWPELLIKPRKKAKKQATSH
jgi:ferredoxin